MATVSSSGPASPHLHVPDQEIQKRVSRRHGFVAESAWIANCKALCGIAAPGRAGRTSSAVTAQYKQYSPAFFMFDPQGLKYIAGLVGSDYLGPSGLFGSALFTRPANSGEIVTLYGTGFGPTNSAAVRPSIHGCIAHIGSGGGQHRRGVNATVKFAGISGAGLYELNVVIPALDDGDHKVVASIGGFSSQDDALIPVKNYREENFESRSAFHRCSSRSRRDRINGASTWDLASAGCSRAETVGKSTP